MQQAPIITEQIAKLVQAMDCPAAASRLILVAGNRGRVHAMITDIIANADDRKVAGLCFFMIMPTR